MRNAFAAAAVLLLGGTAWAQQAPSPAPAPHGHGAAPGAQQRPMSDQDLIASAMSAAPKSVAEGATIVVMDASNNARTLRQGSNGWTCMPDSPASPGQDPMCLDQNAMEWAARGSARSRRPTRSASSSCSPGARTQATPIPTRQDHPRAGRGSTPARTS